MKFQKEEAIRQIANLIRKDFVGLYTDEFYEYYAKQFISIVLNNLEEDVDE